MLTYKTEGIIIRRLNFGEADRIITIFTKNYGKIKAVAKGIRRIKSRRASSLELFNHSVIFLRQGRNLDLISEAQLKGSFAHLKKNLHKVALAFKICEIVDQLTREGQTQKEVFHLLGSYLSRLNRQDRVGVETEQMTKNFEVNLLQILGFLPLKRTLEEGRIEVYIEKIIEKKLKSKKILANLLK